MTKKRLSRKRTHLLSRKEWDFSKVLKDKKEARCCMLYEYARESEWFSKAVEKFRREQPKSTLYPLSSEYPRQWHILLLLEHFQEFPKLPWLKIPKRKRLRAMSNYMSRSTSIPSIYQVGIKSLVRDKRFHNQLLDYHNNRCYQIVIFCIDRSTPATPLAKDFKLWLKEHPIPDLKIVKGSGRSSIAEHLKHLSVRRLLKSGVFENVLLRLEELYPLRVEGRSEQVFYNAKADAGKYLECLFPLPVTDSTTNL